METADLRASKNIQYRAESAGKHYKSPQKIWFKRLGAGGPWFESPHFDQYPAVGKSHGNKNATRNTFSPCWMLNEAYQGKGYAFDAVYAFLDHRFSQKGARRIYAYTEDYNLSSQHLCEKLGMRQEGVFFEFISFLKNPDGTLRYENTVQYALLKKGWDLKQSD